LANVQIHYTISVPRVFPVNPLPPAFH